MNRIGIMQGRLSPMFNGKIQAFPYNTWKEEFALAKQCGFELIEWVLDLENIEHNPILSETGRREIAYLQKEYHIEVPIICCDYFMEYPLVSKTLKIRLQAIDMLTELIRICGEIGIHYIELPFLGNSSTTLNNAALLFDKLMEDILPVVERHDVSLLLEMDLSPQGIVPILEKFPSRHIQINYDTGNSAYWGFNPQDEILSYGQRIANVHIKDCTPEDYSVTLGSGNVDFDLVFKLLRSKSYSGDFVLQSARGENHVELAKNYLQFTRSYINKYFS